MKNSITLFIVFICGFSFGQFSIAYRTSFGGMEAFKNIHQFYNSNRTWLTNELSTNSLHQGFEIGFEGSKEKYGTSILKVYYLTKSNKAAGSIENNEFKRTVKSRFYGVELFDIWYTPLKFKKLTIGGGIMPLALGHYSIKTKVNNSDYIKPFLHSQLENVKLAGINFNYYYFSPHIDILKVNEEKETSVHLQILLQVVPKGYFDLYDYNASINPSTSSNFRQRTLLNLTSLGTKLSINF